MPEIKKIRFEPNEKQAEFLNSRARLLALCGGVGCLGEETRLGDLSLGELSEGKRSFYVDSFMGKSVGLAVYRKGKTTLRRVVRRSGGEVWATDDHHFLTPVGWLPLREILRLGISVAVADEIQHDLLDSETGIGWSSDYFGNYHLGDGSPNPLALGILNIWRRLRMTGDDTCSLLISLLATVDLGDRAWNWLFGWIVEEFPAWLNGGVASLDLHHTYDQVARLKDQNDILLRLSSSEGRVLDSVVAYLGFLDVGEFERRLLDVDQQALQRGADSEASTIPLRYDLLLLLESLGALGNTSYQCNYTTKWEKVQVVDSKMDWFYDLHVPFWEHYAAEGFWHHNSGKTAAGAVKAIMKISQGEPGIIVAPHFPHFTRSTWPELTRWMPWSWLKNRHLEHPYTQRKVLEFEVQGKSVPVLYGGIDEPQSWTGPTVNWIWFDEAGKKATVDAFYVLCSRIRTGHEPQIFLTTTPQGTAHWLYDIFVQQIFPKEIREQFEEESGRELVKYINMPTYLNEKNLDPGYYQSLLAMYGGRYREQELMGKFVLLEGAVWEDFGDENVSEKAEYIPGVPIEWWVDDGYTRNHPRVILMAQVIPPYINVFDEYVVTYELAEISIRNALKRKWPKPDIAYVDSSAAELRRRLWDLDIDTYGATHDVEEGIKHVAPFILDGDKVCHLRFHPRCEFAPYEIRSYVRDERTHRPIKRADNAADCLRYGLNSKSLMEIIEQGEEYKEKAVREERVREQQQEGSQDPRQWYLVHW